MKLVIPSQRIPDLGQLAAALRVLADEQRLRIVHLLACGDLCACDLLEYLPISQPTLSHHLKVLSEEGWVQATRCGKWMRYRLQTSALHNLVRSLESVTQPGVECECQNVSPVCSPKECPS